MKNGTLYSAKVNKAYKAFRRTFTWEDDQTETDPLAQLALAVFACSLGEARARKAIASMLATMVGWNEVRVSTPDEVVAAAGLNTPDGRHLCERLIQALQSVYQHENRMSLDHLKSTGRREAKSYLDSLQGVNEYVVASVMLFSLGGHAIPVADDQMKALHEVDLIDPGASRAEVQAFLERNISAAEAKRFCAALVASGGKLAEGAKTKRTAARRKTASRAKTTTKKKTKKKTKTRSRSTS